MTTSSPGLHRVTPGPTFHTIPDASEPPMWWSSSGWYRKTETGLPSAAHTLLKFTPAAITRTITSNAPGSGTSICSTWKASSGSPSRSWRMTHAAIVGGSSPGSASTCATWVRSTAIRFPLPAGALLMSPPRRVGADGTLLAVAVQVTRPPEPQPEHEHGADGPADPPDEKRGQRVDVVDEPAEVLPEEAGDDRKRHEDRREHAHPRRDLVEAVRRRLEVHVQCLGEQLAAVRDEVDREHEVVADVGEGVVRLAGLDVQHALDRVCAAGEHVALRHDDLEQAEQAAAQHDDAPAVRVGRLLEGVLLELGDFGLDVAQEREQALRERVEDPVDGLVVRVRGGRPHRVELRGRPAMHGHDAPLREVQVGLDRIVLVGLPQRAVEDDQQPVAVVVDLRALAELLAVLDRQRREPEEVPQLGELVVRRRVEVEPERLAAVAGGTNPGGGGEGGDVHPAPRPEARRRVPP